MNSATAQAIEKSRQPEWRKGYDMGRAGKPCPSDASVLFKEGWVAGDSALDEAGNSCQIWGR